MSGRGINPFPGPRAFEEAERENFFGRDREVRQLSSLAVARRVVLLYAASGVGKSSLLQAGLLPRLRALRGTVVLPVVRVGGEAPPATLDGSGNPYVRSVLLDLMDDDSDPGAAGSTSFAAGLGRRLEGAGDRPCFLAVDQFEELFTTYGGHESARIDFFRQLREALDRHPQVTLLLAMREDYIAHVDPFRALFPDHLRTRFRLELLTAEAAREAIEGPFRRAGVVVRDEAVRALVDDLRTRRVQAGDGTPREELGPHVEPVQLQVVCRRLWTRRPLEAAAVDVAQLAQVGRVDRVLAAYYAEQVAAVAAGHGVAERTVREWVDRQLITDEGFRALVLHRKDETQGLANPVIRALVDSHLVRAEKRRGVVWFELAHDRLIQPVRDDNAAWAATHLSTLERRAAAWAEQGRPERLLLASEELTAAERWAAEHGELRDAERDFLAACRKARAAARSERRHLLQLRAYAAATTLFFGFAVVALVNAHRDRKRIHVQRLAAEAKSYQDDRLDLALLLSLEVEREGDAFTARRLLAEGLESNPALETLLHGHRADVRAVSWSRDGRWLASGDAGGAVVLWDVEKRRPGGAPLAGPSGGVWGVDWSRDGRWLAAGGADGAVWLWPLQGDPSRPRNTWPASPRRLAGDAEVIYALRFSPDGRRLAAARSDHTVQLWGVAAGQPGPVLTGAADRLSSVAWSGDGRYLAAGCLDGTVLRWDVETGAPIEPPLRGHDEGVTSLSWRRGLHMLASGSLDGSVRMWDFDSGEAMGWPLDSLVGSVGSIAWSTDERSLAVGGIDGQVVLGDVPLQRPRSRSASGQLAALRSVDFHPGSHLLASGNGRAVVLWRTAAGPRLGRRVEPSEVPFVELGSFLAEPASGAAGPVAARSPDGRRLASEGAAHTIVVAEAPGAAPRGQPLTGHTGPLTSLAWSGDGRLLASASRDGTVRLWNVRLWSVGSGELARALRGGLTEPAVLTSSSEETIHLAWSRGGRLLASASRRRIRLWDVERKALLAGPFTSPAESVAGLVWGPGDATLVSVGIDGTLMLWDVDPASWRERACRVANRNLTPEEWQRFLPRSAYRRTCPDSPEVATQARDPRPTRRRSVVVSTGRDKVSLTGGIP